MAVAGQLQLILLAGARELLAAHAREVPQRDDLCGAFCGALALRAAGIGEHGGRPLDQDAVAIAAGSVVSATPCPEQLPDGEAGRRDYRLAIPHVDAEHSGTTVAGLVDAVAQLSAGAVVPVPLAGPWSADGLAGMFDAVAALQRPVTLAANLATHHLWGACPQPAQLLDYLLDGAQQGPGPDWHVGHWACVVGRVRGPGGSLYVVADTYPALGSHGVHLQPQERLAAAVARPDMPEGGIVVIAAAGEAPAVRAAARALGIEERVWDNGTVTQEPTA